MGGAAASRPLDSWSSEEVSSSLRSLGPKYSEYGSSIVENGVDGDLLASLPEDALEETLEDLEVTNRLHRRVILKKLKDLRIKQDSQSSQGASENVSSGAISPAGGSTDVPADSATADELNVFDDVILKALEKTSPNTIYAGLHLICDEGQRVLAGSLRNRDNQKLQMPRLHLQPHEVSYCSHFVRETDELYLENHTIPDKMWRLTKTPPKYSGYIVKDEQGKRLGSLCILEADASPSEESDKKKVLLKELAAESERQIREHGALLARMMNLRGQIEQATPPQAGQSVFGEIASFFAESENSASFIKDSANEPRFREDAASPDERPHLHPDFYNVVDMVGAPRPPIAKDDMQSIAAVADMNLHDITPDSKIGRKIKKLVTLACRMFGFSTGMLSFHEEINQYNIGVYGIDKEAEEELVQKTGLKILERDEEDGTVFQCRKDRGSSICNYPIFLKKTFVIPDLAKDKTFSWLHDGIGIKAYAGAPLVDDAGQVIANLCIVDFTQTHDEFDARSEAQMEQVAHMLLQEIQNWSMWNKIERLEKERKKLVETAADKKARPPQGEATIVLTDVEGSTSLWESDSKAMQTALEVHDRVIRTCSTEHHGYEIDTEGDAFFLAFHDPVDAIKFALSAQLMLYEADWPKDILKLPQAKEEPGAFKGLRVRMGVHHGPVDTNKHEVSSRTEYTGTAWNLAKSVEAMSHGGQILTTLETWNLASALGERALGAFQVLDLGTHVLHKGKTWDDGVVSKSIVQLVPESLSYDYFLARRPLQLVDGKEEEESARSDHLKPSQGTLSGRQFPPPITKRQVGPSFHDAVYANNFATVLFLYADEAEKQVEGDFAPVRTSLVRLIGETLLSSGHGGYHCHSFMMTFASERDALLFAFDYFKHLKEREAKEENPLHLSKLVKFGCMTGEFLSMGPHKSSGRADYFGRVVNRAARVAGASNPGTTSLGRIAGNDVGLPELEGLELIPVGVKPLKGVKEEVFLYEYRVAVE